VLNLQIAHQVEAANLQLPNKATYIVVQLALAIT
jgi:hypothetical protein